MCEYLGYTREELTSMSPFDLLSEESKREAAERMGKLMAGEDVPPTSEFKIKARDGRELWALVTTRIFSENGKPARAVTVAHDISEQKRVEGQIRHSQKMKAIGTLAGGIAHEFNNALGVLTGNIELMELDLPDNEIIKDYVGSINTSTRRMAELTDQLLAYARGGKYGAKIISLSDFVRETLPFLRRNVGPGIRLETDLATGRLEIKADVNQLRMVLAGLLKNGSEAIEGEGRITIKTRVEEIDEDVDQNHLHLNAGRYVSLTVEDDGRGMDENTKARIFDPFFTTKFQGRGLGMAAMHGIVENHGGMIQVESQLGKGTEVRIYLPSADAVSQGEKDPMVAIQRGMPTLLVIEDDEALVRVIQKHLEKSGYRVLTAKTAAEAIDISQSPDEGISLALLDIGLPDMGGEELYPILMEARPGLKVILASGHSVEGAAQDILDSGAQAFIQKPFSLSTLTDQVAEVLGGLSGKRMEHPDGKC
jgi:PAS domain S-box-containing protein